jgi:hypothetical protein
MAASFHERVLEHTLRELAEYGDVTEEHLAFVRTLDLPNITLAALRDMPNIADDETVTSDDDEGESRVITQYDAVVWQQLQQQLATSAAAATPILFVTKELLENAAASMEATDAACTLHIRQLPGLRGGVEIRLSDNGSGFDNLRPGLGLISCAVVALNSPESSALHFESKGPYLLPRVATEGWGASQHVSAVGGATLEFLLRADAVEPEASYSSALLSLLRSILACRRLKFARRRAFPTLSVMTKPGP